MTVFTEITILVAVAVLVSVVMRFLRQPLIVGYIITGLVVGPLFLNLVKSPETLNLFSEIGIAFLLFIVGLNLTPRVVRDFGKVSILTGGGQLVFTFIAGFFICRLLGFATTTAAYLAIALAFSSTIIVLKLLSDKGDLEKLYGRIAIGFLLVQDFFAIILLFLLPLFSARQESGLVTAVIILRAVVVLILVYFIAAYLLPKWNRFLAQSQEMLFLFAIAWGLGLAAMFRGLGFSLETGALIAGASLSVLPSHDEIHARLKPLRDFFLVLFFILLGTKVAGADLIGLYRPAIILSLFVLIGNPLLMFVIMGLLGYRKKTGFQTGLTVAQVSEFSLIIIALGVNLGHIPETILSFTTVIGLITILGSTYLIMHSDQLYLRFARFLTIFEKKTARDNAPKSIRAELVLLGYNRIGYDFLSVFRKIKRPFLVVDYNPETIELLGQAHVPCLYGDAGDIEFLRLLDFKKTKLIVSTIPDAFTNGLVLHEAKRQNPNATVIAVSHNIRDALSLYEQGMHYVILPHFLGGKYASLLIQDLGLERKPFLALRKKHVEYLKHRLASGHEHPLHEKTR